MAELVTLTIDGQEVSVPKGTTILEAAKRIGEEVPHYCYHPGLSSPAMCRMCLVEVEGAPKPMPGCV
ncbi:MAG: 2Fe-2S iron-sulfur cluster-binding protein, partial [Longimicrobiales bacterium]|nr:2Fe-2S iron-sulfur cluster-binding protein [Longimicrobiales bacterium]